MKKLALALLATGALVLSAAPALACDGHKKAEKSSDEVTQTAQAEEGKTCSKCEGECECSKHKKGEGTKSGANPAS